MNHFGDLSLRIRNCISKVGTFTAMQIDHIIEHGKKLNIAKENSILKSNEVCTSAYLILQGAVRQIEIMDGDEYTRGLFIPTDWVMDVESFTAQSPTRSDFICQTDSLFFALDILAIHSLIAQSNTYIQLGRLLSMIPTNQKYHNLSPEARYQKVLHERPDLLQSFSLKTIASYLEMTPETLSRVRSRKRK